MAPAAILPALGTHTVPARRWVGTLLSSGRTEDVRLSIGRVSASALDLPPSRLCRRTIWFRWLKALRCEVTRRARGRSQHPCFARL